MAHINDVTEPEYIDIATNVENESKKFSTEMDADMDTLLKGLNSKNITLSQWNAAIFQLGYTAADVRRVYGTLKQIASELDRNLDGMHDYIDAIKAAVETAFENTVTNAEEYADSVAQTAETNAKEYADTVTSEVLGSDSSDKRDMTVHSNRKLIEENMSRITNIEGLIFSSSGDFVNHETRISANETNISNHEERISGIEQYLGGDNFIVDGSIAYQKSVPKNAVGKAKILKIGGMTYKSKNLIPFPYANTNKTENGITWTVNADGIVTANGTATETSYFTFVKSSTFLTIPYDMTISGCPSGGRFETYQIQVWKPGFSIDDNGTSAKVPAGTTYIEIYAVVRAGCTANNLTFKPMLNEGTTALPYEPFFEGLRNAAVDEVKSEGKNIFNIQDEHSLDGVDCYLYEYQLKPNTKYTVSSDVPYTDPACVYANGTSSYANGVSIGVPRTVTTDSNGYMYLSLRFNAASAGNAFDLYSKLLEETYYLQIEEGQTATDYKPYVGTLDTFSIPQAVKEIDGYGLNGNYIRWTENKVEFVQEYRREIVTSTSVEWARYFDKESYYVYFGALNGKAIGLNTSICSHFSQKYYAWDEGVVGDYSDHPGTNNVYFNSDKTTLEEWKTWLDEQNASGNPVVLEYKLETPIVTDITDLITSDNLIKVEGGGTLTFENEHGYAVPSEIKYLVTYPKEV